MRHFILALMCGLLTVSAANAQTDSLTIRGHVTDAETGETMIGANVIIERNGRYIAGIATDRDGNFEFRGVPADSLEGAVLKVAYVGYKSQRVRIRQNKLFYSIRPETGEVISCPMYVEPMIDVTETTSGRTFDRQETRALIRY